MAFSTAASNAETQLNNATDGGFVEEYQVGNVRTKRGPLVEQVKAAAMLQALSNRGSTPLTLAKFGKVQN